MTSVKVLLVSVGTLAAGGVIAALLVLNKREIETETPAVPLPVVEVIEARTTNHQFRVRTHGTVTPRTEITLAAEVPGRIMEVSPSWVAGGFFERGDLLAQIDPRDFELAVIRARAALAEAEVRHWREEAEAEVARAEWQALGRGEPNPLLLREPQLAEARAAVESAQAAVEQAERDLKRTRMVAPFAGRVRERHVDVGGFAGAGAPLARIYGTDMAEVRLPLPLDQLAFVEVPLHQRAQLEPNCCPEVVLFAFIGGRRFSWTGRVGRTEGEIEPRTRMLTVVAEVENPHGRGHSDDRPPLAVGLFVEAEIIGRTAADVFVIPRSAVQNRGTVLVVDGDDRLRFRQVEVLRAERDSVIVQAGLQPGEWICVSPVEAPVDGMRVRPILTKNAKQGGETAAQSSSFSNGNPPQIQRRPQIKESAAVSESAGHEE